MSMSSQSLFAAALHDRAMEVPQGLASWSGMRPVKRFDVYRNNVMTGLVQALAIRFPATEAIVGKAFFAAMAMAYVVEDPPRSPVLVRYGSRFAEFVASFQPASGLPYLADVVRLENARIEAYHAADALPLPLDSLATIDADRVSELRYVLHPSFGLVCSDHPIVTIWSMNSGETPLAPIEHWSGEDALIVRPRLSVLIRRLPPGGTVFLKALAEGRSLGEAASAGQTATSDFDLAANLAGLFESGGIIGVSERPDRGR